MNRIQKTILLFGITIIVLMGVYPPWIKHGGSITGEDGGYRLITKRSKNFELDLKRLGVQWSMVAIATGGLLVIFKDSKQIKNSGQ